MPFEDLIKHQCERDGYNYKQYKFLRDTYLDDIYSDWKIRWRYRRLFNKKLKEMQMSGYKFYCIKCARKSVEALEKNGKFYDYCVPCGKEMEFLKLKEGQESVKKTKKKKCNIWYCSRKSIGNVVIKASSVGFTDDVSNTTKIPYCKKHGELAQQVIKEQYGENELRS